MSERDDEKDESTTTDDRGPSISTRFLWVLLGVMIIMVALPLLPELPRRVVAGLMMLWLAWELWRVVYRGRGSG